MPDPKLYLTARGSRLAAAVVASSLLAGALAAAPVAGAAQQADTIAVGDEAPDFTLQSIDGETYRLADLRGDKNLVLIFFRGTW